MGGGCHTPCPILHQRASISTAPPTAQHITHPLTTTQHHTPHLHRFKYHKSPSDIFFGHQATNITDRARSEVSVVWSIDPWTANGTIAAARSPNLAPVLQTFLSQPDWDSFSEIVIGTRLIPPRTAACHIADSVAMAQSLPPSIPPQETVS